MGATVALTGTQIGLLAGGTAFAGAATSAFQASQRNSAVSRSMNAANLAARTQQQQIAQQAGIEQLKNRQRAQALSGRIRVAFAESGVGFGGSYQALQQQNSIDYEVNRNLINQNFSANLARSQSELVAALTNLDAQRSNVLMQAISGGAQGLTTGLTLGMGLNSLAQPGSVTAQSVQDLERGIGPSVGSIGGGGPDGLPSYGGSSFV